MWKLLICIPLILATGATTAQDAQPVTSDTEAGLEAWGKAFEVFSHPRCANCHVPDDNRPRWSGPSYGEDWRYHGMNVNAGQSRIGAESLPCMTCHMNENSDKPHGPPGAPGWALAPVEMVWWQTDSSSICEQIKDIDRNGGRTLDEIIEHIAHDHLVGWGWAPGPGREPAPYSAEQAAAFLQSWASAGAPCPAPKGNL